MFVILMNCTPRRGTDQSHVSFLGCLESWKRKGNENFKHFVWKLLWTFSQIVPTDSHCNFFTGWCGRLRRVVLVSPINSFEVDEVIFFNVKKKKKKKFESDKRRKLQVQTRLPIILALLLFVVILLETCIWVPREAFQCVKNLQCWILNMHNIFCMFDLWYNIPTPLNTFYWFTHLWVFLML